MILQITAVAGGVLALALAGLFWRSRQEIAALRDQSAALHGDLESSPYACLRFDSDGWWLNAKASELLYQSELQLIDMQTLLHCIKPSQRDEFAKSIDGLLTNKHPFSLSLETQKSQRAVFVNGLWSSSHAVLWLQDEGATLLLTERMVQKEREALFLTKLMDAVPMPIWWRDPETLNLSGANKTYNTLLGVGDDPSRARDLAKLAQRTGVAQTESRHLVRDGSRIAIDVTEAPVDGFPGSIVGIGSDMTALENLQMSLAEHISVQDQVLERLTSAISIYGPDRRLKFYNKAYAEMWDLAEDILDTQPTVGTLLETLRRRGILPETADFPAYKRNLEDMFTHLIDVRESMIHLLDGRAIHVLISPHPLGGLIFQYEDVTDQLALETSHNELIAVQRSTLNSLFEGVCVFGRDGRLKLFNSVFACIFGLEVDWLMQGPHISVAAERVKSMLQIDGDWDLMKRRIINRISDPKARQGRMILNNERVLDYAYVPLPDGQCLLLYLDVTDTARVAEALRERNRALENADLLKSQFVANMSYELRTPLNAIVGFAELLKMEIFGNLTSRQLVYVEDIISASTELSKLIGEILDLAAVQAGFMDLELETLDLAMIMQDIVQSKEVNEAFERKAISFDAGESALVKVDPRRIRQALQALIEDALYWLDADDSISVDITPHQNNQVYLTIRVPHLKLDELSWAISICGSSERVLLEPSLGTGTDIGISLARSLIQTQGGSLSISEDSETLICAFPAAGGNA
ncbi:MAG: PAS-domain containing protein [Alphaproteobacteria bacterium]|nr:PAS-domain containing protein [Alphaproteobacteria bacterium]